MSDALRRGGWGPVAACRPIGKVAKESGLLAIFFTFESPQACFEGMRICANWWWPISDAPYPRGVWVGELRGRNHWFSVCSYYEATPTDWHIAALYANDHTAGFNPSGRQGRLSRLRRRGLRRRQGRLG